LGPYTIGLSRGLLTAVSRGGLLSPLGTEEVQLSGRFNVSKGGWRHGTEVFRLRFSWLELLAGGTLGCALSTTPLLEVWPPSTLRRTVPREWPVIAQTDGQTYRHRRASGHPSISPIYQNRSDNHVVVRMAFQGSKLGTAERIW